MDFEDINKKYREIWKKYLGEPTLTGVGGEKMPIDYWPLQYPSDMMNEKCVLFVGFNPALDDKRPELVIDDRIHNDPSKIHEDKSLIDRIIGFEREALGNNGGSEDKLYAYYAQFPRIMADALNLGDSKCSKWAHLDLLPMRDTSQSHLINSLKLNHANLFDLNERPSGQFILDNLSVFADAVNLLDPPAIVIVNGYVSRSVITTYGSWPRNLLDGNNKGNHDNGSDNLDRIFRIRCDNFKETGARKLFVKGGEYPLLLTSMLTGQRALDLGSRERLIWHLKLLLGK